MVVSAGEREGQVRKGAQQPGGVRATTANSVLKGGSIVVLQGFGMGGQQGALDGGLSGDLSRMEMAEYEPHFFLTPCLRKKPCILATFFFRMCFYFWDPISITSHSSSHSIVQ